MARIARVVAPGEPHHVTQRGNRRQQTFFFDEDYDAYVELMAEWCAAREVEVWAYCLMPNHVHLVAAPESEDGLRRAIGEAHRRYSRMVNFREGWRGHLWQGRFASFPMDEAHTYRCARYVELNPVRAGLVNRPGDWRWSSARAHLAGKDDRLARVRPLLDMVGDWREFLRRGDSEEAGLAKEIRRHERTGRPLGDNGFVEGLEKALGRVLRRQRPGPKPRQRTRRR
jgi:putative transposase